MQYTTYQNNHQRKAMCPNASSRVLIKISRSVQTLLLLLLAAASPGFALDKPKKDFELVKSNQTISLYERWFTNAHGESVRELKAVFFVKTNIPEVTTLLSDASQGTNWNMHAKTYNIHPKGDAWVTYIRYGIPWPFGDQDCCLHYRYRPSATSRVVLQFESIQHQEYPVRKNITRITGVKGQWEMDAAVNGKVRITYIISSDRNSKLPRWVSDPIIHNNLFDTMIAFKKILEK